MSQGREHMKRQPSQSSRPLTLPIPDQPTLQMSAVHASKRRRPRPQESVILFFSLIGDALLINLAFLAAYYLRYHVQGNHNLANQAIGLLLHPVSELRCL